MGSGMSRKAKASLTALGVAFAASGLTGCSGVPAEPPDERVAYCVDADGTILDERVCDQDDKDHYRPGSFIWIGNYPTGWATGTRVTDWNNPSYSGQRAQASDTAARSKIGVSSTGKVATGTKGGIGIGKSGTTASGGKSGAGGTKGGVGGKGGSGS